MEKNGNGDAQCVGLRAAHCVVLVRYTGSALRAGLGTSAIWWLPIPWRAWALRRRTKSRQSVRPLQDIWVDNRRKRQVIDRRCRATPYPDAHLVSRVYQ